MVNALFRLFLTFNSSCLILVVYLIKSGITIPFILPYIFSIPNYVSYIVYILVMLVLTYISLKLSKYLDSDNIEEGAITNVEYANDAFLPSYLGYFFVALDVPNNETLFFVYSIIFFFTFFSQTLYFNPIFLLFKYHFYNLTTQNNIRIFLITKKVFKSPKNVSFPSLKRINNFTFIDSEK